MSEYYQQFQRHFCSFPTNFQDSGALEELLLPFTPGVWVFLFSNCITIPFHGRIQIQYTAVPSTQLEVQEALFPPPDHWATDSPHSNHPPWTKMIVNRRIALSAMWLRMISAKWSTSSLRPLMCTAASTKGVWHGLLLHSCHTGWLVRAGYQVTGTVTWRYEYNSDQLESTLSDPYGGQRGVR